MKILVAGGAGYTGSVITADLIAAENQVAVCDNPSTVAKRATHKGAELIVGELGDQENVKSASRKHKVRGVMHFAASIEAGDAMKVPGKYFRNNTTARRR